MLGYVTDTDDTTVLHVPSIGLVVAGHKNKELPDDPAVPGQTRDYLLDVQRLLDEKPSPREFYDQMLELYPNRLNRGPLWYGALGLLS